MIGKKILQKRNIDSMLPDVDLTGIPPLLARLYLNRGITSLAQTSLSFKDLFSFHTLRHIQKAVTLLGSALQQQQRIMIIGDFDADGATSTAVAVKALRQLGATQVDYLIPNRFEFGYGLTPEIVQLAAAKKPHLIITVDNGIASHAGVLAAKQHGMQVLITDHHLPGPTLPEADVIINPNQPEDNFPSKNLAGVGVIFYVMLALRQHLRDIAWFSANRPEPNMAALLDIVALGTVADVVPLDHNNRVLVHQGLKRIRAGQACPGITALLQVAQRSAPILTASDLGFSIAPRLNAAGRLEDMSLGVACLLAENMADALRYASQLDLLNRQRRDIESTMITQAQDLLADFHLAELPAGICLYQPDWHQGVIGILAGRIKNVYHRPTIIFAQSNAEQLKGSARSIPHLHLRDLLANIDAQHPGLMEKFGGHAMAAGVTLKAENFDKFKEIYQQQVAAHLSPAQLQNILATDGELTPDEFTLEHALLLRDAMPWGQDFPPPLFEGKFTILNQIVCGEKHLRLFLSPLDSDLSLEAILFNHTVIAKKEVHLAYRLDVDYFSKNPKLKLVVEEVV